MITVNYTRKFPSTSHPVYAEVQDANGQVTWWEAFHTVEEMESYARRLFYNHTVLFKRMRGG